LKGIQKFYVTYLKLQETFSVERYDLYVVVRDLFVFTHVFGVLFLKMFYDKMRVVILQVVEDDWKKIVVFRGAVTFSGLVFLGFQLQVTVIASGKEKVSGEVAVMSDLVILMGKCFAAVCANGCRFVLS